MRFARVIVFHPMVNIFSHTRRRLTVLDAQEWLLDCEKTRTTWKKPIQEDDANSMLMVPVCLKFVWVLLHKGVWQHMQPNYILTKMSCLFFLLWSKWKLVCFAGPSKHMHGNGGCQRYIPTIQTKLCPRVFGLEIPTIVLPFLWSTFLMLFLVNHKIHIWWR